MPISSVPPDTGLGAERTASNSARDPAIADLEEFTAASQANTVAALTLFLERHSDSRYAQRAREQRDELQGGGLRAK